MRKKIFITGCAKTGTTLVRRLFNGFDLKVYNHYEMSLSEFILSDYDVAKRTANSILSNIILGHEMIKQLEMIKDIIIINVERDKESTLKSDNGYVPEVRYLNCQAQSIVFSDFIDFRIRYDELMKDPDKIQKDIAYKFNLDIIHQWSSYPSFINLDEEVDKTHQGIYKLRPIGAPKDEQ